MCFVHRQSIHSTAPTASTVDIAVHSPVLLRYEDNPLPTRCAGMNLRSTFEESVIGFWGTTAAIVLGCCWVFWAIMRYMRLRRIL